MSTWITLCVIALVPMLLRIPKALSPLRVDAREPSRFSGVFRRYAVHSFTGYASNVGKRGDSYTTGSVSSSGGSNGQTSVTTSINTEVVVSDSFFLTDAQGQVKSFEGTGFDALVGNGHLVSLAWVIRGRKRSGPYFLIYNHATGETFFNDKAIRKAMTFPYPTLYIALLCLMILTFPVLIFFALVDMWQVGRFHRAGVRPLLASLDSKARVAGLPARQEAQSAATQAAASGNDITSALKELVALRDSGGLSEDEFAAAKDRLLTAGA